MKVPQSGGCKYPRVEGENTPGWRVKVPQGGGCKYPMVEGVSTPEWRGGKYPRVP